jgi:hypothetical protein
MDRCRHRLCWQKIPAKGNGDDREIEEFRIFDCGFWISLRFLFSYCLCGVFAPPREIDRNPKPATRISKSKIMRVTLRVILDFFALLIFLLSLRRICAPKEKSIEIQNPQSAFQNHKL